MSFGPRPRPSRCRPMPVLGLLGGAGVETALDQSFDDPNAMFARNAAGPLTSSDGLTELRTAIKQRLGLLHNRLSSPLRTTCRRRAGRAARYLCAQRAGRVADQLASPARPTISTSRFLSFAKRLAGSRATMQDDFAVDLIAQPPAASARGPRTALFHFLPTDPAAARAFARLV